MVSNASLSSLFFQYVVSSGVFLALTRMTKNSLKISPKQQNVHQESCLLKRPSKIKVFHSGKKHLSNETNIKKK